MRCSTVCSLLDDHLDGILPPERSTEIRAHLDSCATCDAEAELGRCVTAPLSAWGDLEPPAGCFERILDRIEALPPEMHVPAPPPPADTGFGPFRHLRGGARWFMTSGAAAAAVLLLAAAVERAGDLGAPERPGRGLSHSASVGSMFTTRGSLLKPGEIALSRTGILVTNDMEERDGLRRRRASRAAPTGDTGLAVPVSADPFGASPR